MKKIGIFAGTFDPIHEGHLEFARVCMKDLGLDKVIFLPEKVPRNKEGVTSVTVRINQIQRSIQHESNFEVKSLGQDRFTVNDTLSILESWYPGAQIVLLVGSDVALHVKLWSDVSKLFSLTSLAIGMRVQHSEHEVRMALADIPVPELHFTIHYTDVAHLSSSQIREEHGHK